MSPAPRFMQRSKHNWASSRGTKLSQLYRSPLQSQFAAATPESIGQIVAGDSVGRDSGGVNVGVAVTTYGVAVGTTTIMYGVAVGTGGSGVAVTKYGVANGLGVAVTIYGVVVGIAQGNVDRTASVGIMKIASAVGGATSNSGVVSTGPAAVGVSVGMAVMVGSRAGSGVATGVGSLTKGSIGQGVPVGSTMIWPTGDVLANSQSNTAAITQIVASRIESSFMRAPFAIMTNDDKRGRVS